MFSRVRERLKRVEDQITPEIRVFMFFRAEEPGLPPYAEQLVAFKAENCVCPHNTLVTVVYQRQTLQRPP